MGREKEGEFVLRGNNLQTQKKWISSKVVWKLSLLILLLPVLFVNCAKVSDGFPIPLAMLLPLAARQITLSSGGLNISETGSSDSFTVVLNEEPAGKVVFDVSTADSTEATLDKTSLTFTSANWNRPQTVTVTGLDDAYADGSKTFLVNISVNSNSTEDTSYHTMDPATITVVNSDDESTGFTLSTATLTTAENGGTQTFTITPNTELEPGDTLTLAVSSTDTSEGTYSPATLTWSAADWNTAKTITVTPQDDVVVDGNQVYNIELDPAVSAGTGYRSAGIQTVAVTNSSDDTVTATYNTAGSAADVVVVGNSAYVADGGSLRIMDVSDPANPTETGSLATPGTAGGVKIQGNYAYIADGGAGLTIFDVSNPAAPAAEGVLNTLGGTTYDVAVSGNYAYVTGTDGKLHIVNVTDTTNPALTATYNFRSSAPNTATSAPWVVQVAGSYAYVVDQDGYSLNVVDVSNPAVPVLADSISFGPSWQWRAEGLFIKGDYAYIATGLNGLYIVDISNPTDLSHVGSLNTGGGWHRRLFVAGNYVYMGADGSGFQIVDISDPTNPVLAGDYTGATGTVSAVYISGKYAYLANDNNGLHVFQVLP